MSTSNGAPAPVAASVAAPGFPQHAPMNDAAAMMRYDANKKSAMVAYLLWFFTGSLGGHRFYLGRTGTAVAQLVITLVSLVLTFVGIGFLGLFVVGIWVLVDAFLIPGMARDHNNRLIASLGR